MCGDNCIIYLAHLSHVYLIERFYVPRALADAWPCLANQLSNELFHHLVLTLQVVELGLASFLSSQILLILGFLLAHLKCWRGYFRCLVLHLLLPLTHEAAFVGLVEVDGVELAEHISAREHATFLWVCLLAEDLFDFVCVSHAETVSEILIALICCGLVKWIPLALLLLLFGLDANFLRLSCLWRNIHERVGYLIL